MATQTAYIAVECVCMYYMYVYMYIRLGERGRWRLDKVVELGKLEAAGLECHLPGDEKGRSLQCIMYIGVVEHLYPEVTWNT